MNLPNRLTIFRLILAPLFFLAFYLTAFFPESSLVLTVTMMVIYAAIELTDMLDGIIARQQHLVTALGKVMDPFADVISRITYFLCFTAAGLMPWGALLLILYREFSATFLRMVMMRRGIVVAANSWGKLKAILYALSGFWAMLHMLFVHFSWYQSSLETGLLAAQILFWLSAFSALASFVTYLKPVAHHWHEIDK